MDADDLRTLFDGVRSGAIDADEAVARLRRFPFADLGFARVDHHRTIRQGRPEAVYAPGKSPEQVTAIVEELLGAHPDDGPVIVSRADTDQVVAATRAHPGAIVHGRGTSPSGATATPGALATLVWRPRPPRTDLAPVVVVTAGTADLPVADEAATVLEAHGIAVRRITDAGVAGIHRLLGEVPDLQEATAVVVVAGMEAALASVIGGLTGAPVVAVPTSVGYGSGLDGVTALLAMTASCASGITVVGIDNGFGAACSVLRLVFATSRLDTPAIGPDDGPTARPATGAVDRNVDRAIEGSTP